ncbi:hypothetical protein VIBNISOn1_p0199 [Vibrio nigripulchritudo SOn1]|uniref:Transposase n=1 Tax=Vibrio nigripulchritudo SOn1 TaxID=1238450 RepID=A0AAV2W1S2_9VIBR|nr:hypothetical protein VIBNISOn1_p0199 [Vibrio nigripulchritudo SOn1]
MDDVVDLHIGAKQMSYSHALGLLTPS